MKNYNLERMRGHIEITRVENHSDILNNELYLNNSNSAWPPLSPKIRVKWNVNHT
jgi:hypothetical protein